MIFYYIVNRGPKSKLFPAAKMQKNLKGLDMSPFLLFSSTAACNLFRSVN